MSLAFFRASYLSNWCFILGAMIYPLTAVLILELNLPNSISNIALKIVYLILYILLILEIILKNKIKTSLSFGFYFIFLSIYSVRLLFDISVRGIDFSSGNKFYVYAYFFGATLIPCIALTLSSQYINYKIFIRNAIIIVLLSNLFLLYYLLSKDNKTFLELMAGRAFIESDKNLGAVSSFVNPIIIGQTGAILVIFSTNMLVQRIKKSSKLLFIGLMIVGFANVIISASRGPFLFMVFCILFSLIHYIYSQRKNLKKFIYSILIFFIILTIFRTVILSFASKYDITLFQRFETLLESRKNAEKEERDYLFTSAVDQFISNPIIGDQYVLKDGNGYPHNIAIEVLMSTGIIGGFFFLITLLIVLYKIYKIWLIPYNSTIFILLNVAMFYFLCGMTSGSIFVNPEIWLSIALILILPTSINE
jgi:O-antigen ligase